MERRTQTETANIPSFSDRRPLLPMCAQFALQPLLDLSQEKLEDATRKLGELIAHEQESTRKLQILTEYRNDYLKRFEAAARTGLSPDAWQNYVAFVSRIDEAIEIQAKLLEQSRQHTVAGQKQWVNQRNKVKALGTLHERHIVQQFKLENRQEQKQSDEFSMRNFRIKQGCD